MQVDVVSLIAQLSKGGIETSGSGYSPKTRRVSIEFASSDDALLLLNVIARYVPEGDPFHARIFKRDGNPLDWIFSILPIDRKENELAGFGTHDLNWTPPVRFTFVVGLHFPPEDLPIITELMRDYNARR